MTGLRNNRKAWFGGGVLAAVFVLALAWLFVIGPELSNASSLDAQTSQAEQQNTVLQGRVAKLKTDSMKMDTLNQQLRDARAALPIDSGLPDFTRQLSEQARTAGAVIVSVTPGTPVEVNASSGAPVVSGSAQAGGSAAGKLYGVPVTMVVSGNLASHKNLLAAMEQGPRRALIESVAFGAGESTTTAGTSVDTSTTMTVKLQVFVAPQTPADQAELQKQLGG